MIASNAVLPPYYPYQLLIGVLETLRMFFITKLDHVGLIQLAPPTRNRTLTLSIPLKTPPMRLPPLHLLSHQVGRNRRLKARH